jgi:N-acetylmuramoyl-L-alanine amidase
LSRVLARPQTCRVRIYRLGDDGPEILDIQQRLRALGMAIPDEERGRFGDGTREAVVGFQVKRRLRADGLVGPDTWGQLVEASYLLGDRTLYLHAPHMRGDDVRVLQRKLNALGFDAGREDGVHGPATDRAVREFQRNVGEAADGVVGLHTIDVLDRMRPVEGAHSRALVRESEELRTMTATLAGRVIAIDPGEAGGPWEADIARGLAIALADAGARPEIIEAAGRAPSERARMANDLGAAVCISLHEGSDDETMRGPACAHFGSESTHSPAGERLARMILDELERLSGTTGTLEGLTVAMLRETRMPAVQVEPARGVAAANVGAAVAAGVRRFYGEPSD